MKRRSFLTRTGLLISSVSIAESFKIDLIDKIGRSLLPRASASTDLPKRQLELCFRAGIPMMIFATGQEFSRLSQARYSNFSYAGNEIIRTNDASNLYFNQDSQALMRHAANIAITQGVDTEGSGHTDLFTFREGGRGRQMITPIVELADRNPTRSVVHGVKFPGSARNINGSSRGLVALNTNSAFQGLFRNPKLQLSSEEVNQVLAAAQKISRRQALLLEEKLESSLDHAAAHNKAAQMFAVDYSTMLSKETLPSELKSASSYESVRDAIGLSLKAMENNLINSSMVIVNLGDWHGYQTNKQNSAIIRQISEIIAATVDYLKVTNDPAAPGYKLWDTTTIVAGSEFTRGISQFSIDNNDGGTQGIMLIGKNVVGNYYGGFTLADSSSQSRGTAHGFDPISGNITMNLRNTGEQLYQTVRFLAGSEQNALERSKVLSCMVKKA